MEQLIAALVLLCCLVFIGKLVERDAEEYGCMFAFSGVVLVALIVIVVVVAATMPASIPVR